MSHNPTIMPQFKAAYTKGAAEALCRNEFPFRQANTGNPRNIFTPEELSRLYSLVKPYQKAGAVLPNLPLVASQYAQDVEIEGMKEIIKTQEKESIFTIYLNGYPDIQFLDIGKNHSSLEILPTYFLATWDSHRMMEDPNFGLILTSAQNQLRKNVPTLPRTLSLVP